MKQQLLAKLKERETLMATAALYPPRYPTFNVWDVIIHRPFDKPFPGLENPPVVAKPAFSARQLVLPLVLFPLWSIAVCMATGSLYPLLFMLLPVLALIFFYVSRARIAQAVIVLDHGGIRMSEQYYFWEDVLAAFIVERLQGRQRQQFLVLGLANGELAYHPVYNTDARATFTGQLCTTIRYFMKRQNSDK